MERREFLRTLIGGVAAASAVRAWPFRVYSFPAKIELATSRDLLSIERAVLKTLEGADPWIGFPYPDFELILAS